MIARMVRVRRPANGTPSALGAAKAKQQRAKELVALIGHKEEEAAKLGAEAKALCSELLELLRVLKKDSEESEGFEGVITTPKSRSTTTVDTEKFFRALGGDIEDLLKYAVVPVTAARQVFGEKEIVRISTTTQPADKDPVLVVRRIKQ